jgi:CubicO group peptidase (beta-lactamase class C family)
LSGLLLAIAGTALLGWAPQARGQDAGALPADVTARIDRIAQQTLARTGVPSASIAIVRDGRVVYAHAYGDARVDPPTPSRPEMRYSVGSISKQFTATAILMLAEQGKLSLDDTVSKFLPSLTRANEVTIRELLSHTSGYQDYWPQDYVPLFMNHPTTAKEIIDRWARKPLDFDPGTKWQYSNTNYVIAGVIVEQVSGEPLVKFLQEHIFAPLGMQGIADVNMEGLGDKDATGYMRFALGPPRVAPKEAAGWLFAAGELAMTAGDLAKWDIGLMSERLLKPASYKEMETEIKLKDGKGTGYGLGVDVGDVSGHRALSHGGEVSGYVSSNYVFPDDHSAVAVLTNEDASSAAGVIARQISTLLLGPDRSGSAAKMQRDRKIFEDLQHGKIDRSLFTEDGNAYFTEQALGDFASSLGPLGPPQQASLNAEEERGGMTMRIYRITFATQSVLLTIYEMPDGKIEQFQVAAAG